MHTQYNIVTLAYRNFINGWCASKFLRIKVDECCINELYLTG